MSGYGYGFRHVIKHDGIIYKSITLVKKKLYSDNLTGTAWTNVVM